MNRLAHGSSLSDDDPNIAGGAAVDGNAVDCPPPSRFGYLFPDLQTSPSDRLPDVLPGNIPVTQALIKLGNTMVDPEPNGFEPADPRFDSKIPSAYSYFGQFITHEVVFAFATVDKKVGPDTAPMEVSEVPQLTNARTALLDLDSVYGPILDRNGKCYSVPRTDARMEVAIARGGTLPGTDVPRENESPFTARIGDRRNDANLITSQMHLAFLLAHNACVNSGKSFDDAQKLLRQHFQWLVVSDFLPKVVDQNILKSLRDGNVDLLARPGDEPFMPIEFSAAAFRFGHSMARHRYNYNQNYDKQRLSDLFLPRKGWRYHPVTPEWIIDWKRFLPGGQNVARRMDTRLVQPLFRPLDGNGQPLVNSKGDSISLASLDLLRGYLLRLPTGQAVAKALGFTAMTATEIEAVGAAVSDEQKTVLSESGLSSHTPLWFYILAEAAHSKDGLCLGPVGSTIVAGVLLALVRRSTDSILNEPNWVPTLGTQGEFDLAQLFRLAGV